MTRAVKRDEAVYEYPLGTSAQFWMNLQSQYELAIMERQRGLKIIAEVEAA